MLLLLLGRSTAADLIFFDIITSQAPFPGAYYMVRDLKYQSRITLSFPRTVPILDCGPISKLLCDVEPVRAQDRMRMKTMREIRDVTVQRLEQAK